MTMTTIAPSRDPLVLGLTGRAGAGKDTAADFLCEHYGFVRCSFAAALKDMAAQLLEEAGLDHAHIYEAGLKEQPMPGLHGVSGRQLLQTLGDWGRALHPDLWVTLAAMRLGLGPGQDAAVHDRIVLTDVRFPNEARWLAERGGLLVRVVRDHAIPVRQHVSEAHTDTLPAQLTLPNEGLTPLGLQGLLAHLMAELGVPETEALPGWGALG